MRRGLFLFGLLILALVLPGQALAFNATGVWESSLFGSTIITQIEQRGPILLGVATVTGISGETNTYHLVGTIMAGDIRAWHSSGHMFEGKVESKDDAQGILTFKGGRTLFLQGKRNAARHLEVSFPQETWEKLLQNVPPDMMISDQAPFETIPGQ